MDFLIGFVIAIVIALTGVGAGSVTAPLLILVLNVPVEIAVGTALAYSAIVKLIVVPVQLARKQVSFRVLGFMLVGGLPGVILGSLLFRQVALHGQKSVLYLIVGAIILVSSAWNLWHHFRPQGMPRPDANRPRWITATMLPVGVEVGFSSSGAGALGTLALLGFTSLTTAQVVGTDLAFGLVITLVGTGVHMMGGAFHGLLLLKLAIGGVAGAVVGTWAAPLIPNRQLRFALSLWLFVMGLQFCYQAAMR